MTKLTKEQIEQERVKFEEYIKKIILHPKAIFRELEKCDVTMAYLTRSTQEMFRGWIARAELDKGA